MRYTKKEREYYNQYRERACNKLKITKNEFNWFRRKSEELQRMYENDCNGYGDDEAEDRLEKLIEKRASVLGLELFFQRDPRGATVYLDLEPIPDNNYTRAVCVY